MPDRSWLVCAILINRVCGLIKKALSNSNISSSQVVIVIFFEKQKKPSLIIFQIGKNRHSDPGASFRIRRGGKV
jgi:hypothetical protein